jgi:predicted porin
MVAVAATYGLGNATLKAIYGEVWRANNPGGNNDASEYAVQAQYALGKKAGVKAEYAVLDEDAADNDVDTVTFSYYVNF